MSDKSIYQLKITLQHIEPPIWRRIQLHRDTPLDDLHHIMQIVMGWDNEHLHAFRIGRDTYSDYRDEFGDMSMRDETGVPLSRVTGLRKRFVYEYDFGDGWEHLIAVEKELPMEPEVTYPRCIEGARACPPEDCGGVPGYERLLEVLRNPNNEEHERLREWIGDEFDAETFDIERINEVLRNPDYTSDDDEDYEDDDGGDLLLSPDELAALDEKHLIEHLIDLEDRAPRYVIDACAARGEAMVAALAELCLDEEFWGQEAVEDECEWWLRLHGPYILGLIATESAGDLIVEWMRRIDQSDDDSMQDWLAGNWPALFANKPDTAAAQLLALGRSRDHSWFFRCEALDSYLFYRSRSGADALEAALDEIAAIVADETDDHETRCVLASNLMSFPRERLRPLLEHVAATAVPWSLTPKDIERAFEDPRDEPQWEIFHNPWKFYEPEEIQKRQQRWAEEARADMDADFDDSPADVEDPYLRKQPKIGRNDPCPCGSGRKYKKCCMNNAGGMLH